MSLIASTVMHAFNNVVQTAKVKDLSANTVQVTSSEGLTTDHGVKVSDTDNWCDYLLYFVVRRLICLCRLRVSDGTHIGPSLLEDQIAREKIHRFDHERIPERVVHARGAGAHGYFRVFNDSAKKWTTAGVLTDPSRTTPVFLRFSTVQGSKGSAVSSYMHLINEETILKLVFLFFRIQFAMFAALQSNFTPKKEIGI